MPLSEREINALRDRFRRSSVRKELISPADELERRRIMLTEEIEEGVSEREREENVIKRIGEQYKIAKEKGLLEAHGPGGLSDEHLRFLARQDLMKKKAVEAFRKKFGRK